MNFFYMTAGGHIDDCWKIDDFYVTSIDVAAKAFREGQGMMAPAYAYSEKLSDICLWLADNATEFSVGICYGEHGCAVKYKYEIFILDDEEAVQFKLSWV